MPREEVKAVSVYGSHAPKADSGWNFNGSDANELTLKPLCQQAEKHFQLPARRLCRYFAGWDDTPCGTLYATYYRGFHVPLSGRGKLPRYLQGCFFHISEDIPDGATFDEQVAFDDMIYIRHGTCSNVTGCIETYAHELQHFVQHGRTPRLWAVNNVLRDKLKTLEPNAIATDVPSERDANIVSKRVAEIVCGAEAVRTFAAEQVRLMELAGEHDEKARWVFFRDVPSSTAYSLLEETAPLVEKYKKVLDFGIDVDQPEWWVGPLEDDKADDADC